MEQSSHDKHSDSLWSGNNNDNKKTIDIAIAARRGGIKNYYESLPGRKEAARQYDILKIVCMDGRINESNAKAVVARDGGGGVLRNEDIQSIAADYIKLAQDIDVIEVVVTSHDSCGACKLSGKTADEQKTYYESLAAAIEKAGLNVKIEHIGPKSEEGRKLKDMHIERAVYYPTMPVYNPQKIEKLPTGFVISRGVFSEGKSGSAYGKANVSVALSIAFGDHGFGHKFSAKQPFTLMAIGHDDNSLQQAIIDLEEAKKEFIAKVASQNKFDKDYLNEAILVTGAVEKTA
jgi:hypothetical protein